MTAPFPSPAILKQVRALALTGRRATDTLLGGEVRSVFRGTGMEFADVRPYTEGDDIRHLDWNLLARTGQPWIKLYTETRELTVLLIVDRSRSLMVGDPGSKLARATEVAALLALVAEQQHDRIGLLAFAERVGPVIPPGRGRRHAYGVVRRLLELEPAGRTDLAGALRAAGGLLSRRSLVLILSDFVATGWESPLRGLAARHDVTAIVLEDPTDRAVPAGGWIDLEDAERGRRMLFDSGSAAARQRVERTLAVRRNVRSQTLGGAGVREVVIRTDDDPHAALRAAFGRHRQHG